jgi:hypothetical protein
MNVLVLAASEPQQQWLTQLVRKVWARPVVVGLELSDIQLLTGAYQLVLVDLDKSQACDRQILKKRLKQTTLNKNAVIFTSAYEDEVKQWATLSKISHYLFKNQPENELLSSLAHFSENKPAEG